MHYYPVYQVSEQAESAKISNRFKVGDPLFRSNSFYLPEAESYAAFKMWTKDNQLHMQIEYDALPEGQHGEMMLFFDLAHSRRKFFNAIAFIIHEDGEITYREYHSEPVTMTLPRDVVFKHRLEKDRELAELSIPYHILRLDPAFSVRRTIGFNAIRTVYREKENFPTGENTLYMTWSGVKGDRIHLGQGAGSLLFTRGLDAAEISSLTERTAAESSRYFTLWRKLEVPEHIRQFVCEKQRGLTVSLNEQDIEKARWNAEHTKFGRNMKAEILEIANYWAGKTDHELFDLVPVGNPREVSPSVFFGDPLSGGKGTTFQMCLERPYQCYNPATKEWWYNGKKFNNPTTQEELVLHDDGEGFVAPEGFPQPGVRYMFTASYRMFLFSMLMGNPRCEVLEDREVCPETSGYAYAGAISNLAFAYQLTLDKKYAYKALILISRIAELYPFMNGKFPTAYDTVQIAEPTTSESFWLCNFFSALDLIYDSLNALLPQLCSFFADKPDAENKSRQATFNFQDTIKDMIAAVLYSCEIEKQRTADWAMRWIAVELLVASFMQSGKLMHHILYEGKASLESKVRNSFFRDGRYAYDSLKYIEQISQQTCLLANHNYRFQDESWFPESIDMFEDDQFGLSRTIQLYCNLKCGALTPMFGDVRGTDNAEPISELRKAGKFPYSPTFEIVASRKPSFRQMIGPILTLYDQDELNAYRVRSVRVTKETSNNVETKYKLALLLLACAEEAETYQKAAMGPIRSNPNPVQPSMLLEDSQVSIFRSGTTPHNCKHVVLYGQPSAGHRHGDKLGLWIGAYGYHLLTGIGDYPYTWVSPKWQAWEMHAAACSVVIVDGQDQKMSYSRQKCHYEGKRMQISGMANSTAYPGTSWERWCFVVQAPNEAQTYVVDLNNLAGGNIFDYNTIGLDSSLDQVTFSGVEDHDWIPMKGTLAGEDVPLYSQPGYGWMRAVKRAPISSNASVSWTYAYQGAALRVHALPDVESSRELVCSLGERGGQEPGNSKWEPFVMWRDQSEYAESHSAAFVSVLEPYEQNPFILAIQPLHRIGTSASSNSGSVQSNGIESSYVNAVGIEIQFENEWRDIFIHCNSEDTPVLFHDSTGRTVQTDAQALLLRYHNDRLIEVEALGYTIIHISSHGLTQYESKREAAVYKGTITEVDIDQRHVTVQWDQHYSELAEGLSHPAAWEGIVSLIDSPDYVKPSTYIIHQPKVSADSLTFTSSMPLTLLDEEWDSPHKRRSLGDKQLVQYEGKNVYIDVKRGDQFKVFNQLQQSVN